MLRCVAYLYCINIYSRTLHGDRSGAQDSNSDGSHTSCTTGSIQLRPARRLAPLETTLRAIRVASGLASEAEPRQVSTLLYCMGEDADNVLTSTNITDAEKQKYATVVKKFEDFFRVRRNVIFERARFNRRNQLEHESIEQYITTLYTLIDTCDYGDLKEELLRDRIVVGIRDQALSERLQCDSELTLTKVKQVTRQREAVKEQHNHLKGDGSPTNPIIIDQVRGGQSHATRGTTGAKPSYAAAAGGPPNKTPQKTRGCKRCGTSHGRDTQCPAQYTTCFKCNRKGHFGSQCLSKTVAAVASTANETAEDEAFLFPVTMDKNTSWSIDVQLDDREVPFKLDTGAEVTAISDATFSTLRFTTLQKPARVLYGPTSQALQVLGQFTGTLSIEGRSSKETIFVIQGLKTNLLGLPAITSLQLLSRVNAATTGAHDIPANFPNLFSGLGNLGQPCKIQLKDGATPYALYTPRRVPIPLRAKVKDELTRMENLGVITKVEQHTPWCAGMVVVPKNSGEVRICVDLKPLNESVLR